MPRAEVYPIALSLSASASFFPSCSTHIYLSLQYDRVLKCCIESIERSNAIAGSFMVSKIPDNSTIPSRWLTRRIPNSAILLEDTKPRLPTAFELQAPPTTRTRWIWAQKRGLLFLPNGRFIETVRFPQHLDLRLAVQIHHRMTSTLFRDLHA